MNTFQDLKSALNKLWKKETIFMWYFTSFRIDSGWSYLKNVEGNMIWATVSSWSCFCWLYGASPSLATKNIINLILVSTIWWFHVKSLLLCCWKMVFALTSVFSWQNSISLCPASFCTPRPNLPITPGISWLPTFAFQSPIMKRTSF